MTKKTKINEAPLVIYLQDKDDNGDYGGNVAGAEISWCQDQVNENDERYIRADLVWPLIRLIERAEIAGDLDTVCPFCNVVGDRDHLSGCLAKDSRTNLQAFQLLTKGR